MRVGAILALVLLAAGCDEARLPEPGPASSRKLAVRPTEVERAPLWRYDPDDVVERYDSPEGNFRVHFTREGRHRVPAQDADADGVPDYVAEVAATYEEVLAFYTGLGFRAPLRDGALRGDNGGDDRFDVYLLDFARSADGSFGVDGCTDRPRHCVGHVVQENDFAGYSYPSRLFATRVLASHELFHAVQAAYDHDQDVIVSEATAVWASDAFDPSLREMEAFAIGYLEDPGRSLDVPPGGPVPRFAYGMSLFFRFLEERYDRDLMRELWEHLEDGRGLPGGTDDAANPKWMGQLPLLLAARGSGFAEAMADFARWNLYTGRRADPAVAYADAARYPAVAMERVEAPHHDERLRVFRASAQYFEAAPGDRETMTAALVPGLQAGALDDLVLWLAAERGERWTTVERVEDPAAGAQAIDTAGATRFVAVVVNTASTGDSRRPGLCLGSPAEVAACTGAPAEIPDADVPDAQAAEPDGGAEDASAPDGAAARPDGTPDAPASGGSGGCAVTRPVPAPPMLLLLLLPAVLRRRARAR